MEKDNTTTIAIFNAVGGATVEQWNWNCADQNALVHQGSGNAASMSGANAGSAGGSGNGAAAPSDISAMVLGLFGLSSADSNTNGGGNAGNAGAISGSLATTGNISLVNQNLAQTAKSESNANVINMVIAKVTKINRVKLEVTGSYNQGIGDGG